MLKKLNEYLALPLLGLIRLYQWTLSPDKGLPSLWLKWKVCLHHPHCSQYSIDVLKRYGFVPGVAYALDRVISCNPMSVRKYPTFDSQKAYDPPFYRVVFFSWSPLGEPFLKQLFDDPRFEIVWVVSMPPKPVWRGQKVRPNTVAQYAKKLWISNIQTPSKLWLKASEGMQFYSWLKKLDPDFLVVVAYGKIIPKHILDAAKIAPINVHWSLLPKYRWASPLQQVFLDQETKTGITVMKMNEKMDEWEILDKLEVAIPFDWTVEDLINWIKQYWPKFLADTLRNYAKWEIKSVVQNNTEATYTSKISKEDGQIDPWTLPLNKIYAKYRAYKIWPWIWFLLDGDFVHKDLLVKVEKLEVDQNEFEKYKDLPLIVDKIQGKLNPAISLLRVKPAGRSSMDFEDFKRWYRFLQVT